MPLLVASAATAWAGDGDSTFPRLAHVSGERVNVRTGPSINHFAFARFERGTALVAIALEGDWYRVRLPAAERCWMSGKFLEETGDQRARVTGNRVAVRVSPGTQYTAIGQVTRGTSLVLSGRKDKTGEWVEFQAPLGATACIHKDYVKLGRALTAEQEMQVVQSSLASPAAARGGPAADAKGVAAKPVPAIDKQQPIGVASERLLTLRDQYAEIHRRPITEWDFATVRRDLISIRETSEDQVEAEFAVKLLDVIDRDIRFKRQYEEGERKKQEAREALADAEKKESDVVTGVHQYPPSGPGNRQATGWVIKMGKNSSVQGTHKLMKGNRLLYYIKSEQLDLNDYVNKRVKLRGVLTVAPPEVGADLIKVTDITVLSR